MTEAEEAEAAALMDMWKDLALIMESKGITPKTLGKAVNLSEETVKSLFEEYLNIDIGMLTEIALNLGVEAKVTFTEKD